MDASGQFALAYALTTTAGLRGFLTLFAASLAAHYHWIHPSAQFAWLASSEAMTVLGIFAVLEIAADKVPIVDHGLHAVSFVARPLAGAILVGTTVHAAAPSTLYTLMAIGALNTLFVHSSSAAARATSTVTTLGAANPSLSLGEDILSIGGIVLALLHPYLGAIVAAAGVAVILLLAGYAWRRRSRYVPFSAPK